MNPSILPRRVRFAAALCVAAACAALVNAAPARAQSLCNEDPTACQAPVITITPGTTTWTDATANKSVAVTVQWCSGFLSPTSRHVYLDGVDVISSFVAVSGTCGPRQATLVLTPGTHTVTATGSTTTNVLGTASVTYTYTRIVSAVTVAPGSQTAQRSSGQGGSELFVVKNAGSGPGTFALSAACSGSAVSMCLPAQTTVTLAAGDSAAVPVGYSTYTSGAGTVATVMLKAWRTDDTAVRDSGKYVLSLVSAPADDGIFEMADRTRLERGNCVIIAAGDGTAFECGDLRAAHALPATRLLNRTRAPVLVYSSQHARPYPVVAASVRPLAGTRPDAVQMVLHINNANYSSTFPGWPSDTAKHVAVGFDASSLPTGVYDYTLEVTGTFNSGGSQSILSRSGQMAVVNRAASPYGAGWWVAGVEQLVPAAAGWLWVGGDGSTRLYRPVAGTTDRWAADAFDRPDTLKLDGTEYVRTLPGQVQVRYNASGQHTRTVDALGRATTFTYSGGRLASIALPVSGYGYTFEYGSNGGTRLSRIYSPGPDGARSTVVAVSAAGDVTGITDPDSTTVLYGYDSLHRLNTRTDRRHYATQYGYDASSRAGSVTRPDGKTAFLAAAEGQGLPSGGPVTRTYTGYHGFRPGNDITYFYVDRFGQASIVVDALGRATYLYRYDAQWPARVTSMQAANGRLVGAAYDARGNLAATTDFGTAVSGRIAITAYEWDPAWDEVTRATLPEGEFTRKAYDTYGRLSWVQPGNDTSRRTSFAYNPPTHATAPGLLSTVTIPGVAGGSPVYEQISYDARGNLEAVTSPLGVRSEVVSDAVGRVTLARTQIDPPGAASIRFQEDSTRYDAADRMRRRVSRAPAMNGAPAQTLVVENTYDDEGNLLSVSRQDTASSVGAVITRFTYDVLGRKVKEIAPDATPGNPYDNPADSTVYDENGNATEVHTRRGFVIRMEYDFLNRDTLRITPAAYTDSTSRGIPTQLFDFSSYGDCVTYSTGGNRTTNLHHPYPRKPNASLGRCGYEVPADTAVFRYDSTGNLIVADNRDARVHRSYFPNGLLQYDSLVIRTLNGGGATDLNASAHRYGIAYTYDLNGRVRTLTHPAQLAADGDAVRGTASYTYDPLTGALSTVTDPMGNVFQYGYDERGRLATRTQRSPAGATGLTQTYGFDDDDNATRTTATNPGGVLLNQLLQYDGRGKVLSLVDNAGPSDAMAATYSGLGMLRTSINRGTTWATNGLPSAYRTSETFTIDALGNQTEMMTEVTDSTGGGVTFENTLSTSSAAYQAGTGRQLSGYRSGGRLDAYEYDAGGNVTMHLQPQGTAESLGLENRVSYYGADEKLRAADWRQSTNVGDINNNPYRTAFEEYWYDALGRRVLVATRREAAGGSFTDAFKLHFVRRTVWAGDAELWEIQMPLNPTLGSWAENDTSTIPDRDWSLTGNAYVDPNPFWGRVAYTYGGSLDRPLSITRFGYGDQLRTLSTSYAFRSLRAFSIIPLWDARGNPILGTYGGGELRKCEPGDNQHCVYATWPAVWYAFYRDQLVRSSWHGTLLEDKRDFAGTFYRRNRYYDPGTGKFTQEDPAGLAGGLNAYGFANGDPVNFADPYGLCPRWVTGRPCTAQDLANLAAGFGDGATFGLTRFIRRHTPGGDGVNYASGLYKGGVVTGIVAVSAISAGLAAEANAARLGAEGSALARAEPVGSALKDDLYHRAATFVREQAARAGQHFKFVGGDGAKYTLTQIAGELDGVAGRFEYIVNEAGELTHQVFVRGGRINGIPMVP